MKKIKVLGLLCGGLLAAACSNDYDDSVASEPNLETQQLFTLRETPDELLTLDRPSGDEIDPEARATTAAGNDRGRFNIGLKFLVPPTPAQRAAFEEAAERWERIIIKDVPSIAGPVPSAFSNGPDVIGAGEIIDDVVIEVVLQPIDGPGSILGSAGPVFVRTSDFLTITGVMFFDTADLAALENVGLFDEVIVHEMGHVLGIGTLWNVNRPDLGITRNLLTGTFEEPYFAGRKANVFWNAEGGLDELPIENIGGGGTRFGHWRESAMDNELMTGFLNLGENPLSRITAGSMADLGYGSASVGESYDLPKGTPGVDPNAGNATGTGVDIAAREILLEPIGLISSSGKN